MHTNVYTISNVNLKNSGYLKLCATTLKNGGIGAFPTETVYGLGANIFNAQAIEKIFIAKKRPMDNPLIAHISNVEMLHSIVTSVNKKSQLLIESFWPGPLTIIFNKKDEVPNIASGNLKTIGVRLPNNDIARELISLCDFPIVAPSANLSGKPSPTRFSHVEFDLKGSIDFIIDGEKSIFGLESTIIDCSNPTIAPVLLRPGSITVSMIQKVIGHIEISTHLLNRSDVPVSPGMKYKHYSPKATVIVVVDFKKLITLAYKHLNNGEKIGILTSHNKDYINSNFIILNINGGKNLYHSFRKFDFLKVNTIFVEGIKETNDNLAILNRLKKAASLYIT